MSRDAESTSAMYLVKASADHLVADLVPPIDQLSRLNTERQPVPGLGGDLLPQDHQQIITGVRTPCPMRVSRVVLRGRDEIQARGPRTSCSGVSFPSEYTECAWQSPRYHLGPRAATRGGGNSNSCTLPALPNPKLTG